MKNKVDKKKTLVFVLYYNGMDIDALLFGNAHISCCSLYEIVSSQNLCWKLR